MCNVALVSGLLRAHINSSRRDKEVPEDEDGAREVSGGGTK